MLRTGSSGSGFCQVVLKRRIRLPVRRLLPLLPIQARENVRWVSHGISMPVPLESGVEIVIKIDKVWLCVGVPGRNVLNQKEIGLCFKSDRNQERGARRFLGHIIHLRNAPQGPRVVERGKKET